VTVGGAEPPLAAIFGCAGTVLAPAERDFFRQADPTGYILFARNVESPSQLRALVADLRDSAGRSDVLVLIDQEGGRVARLGPPHWRAAPAQGLFGALAARDEAAAVRATALNARLIAAELAEGGIDVDCLPLLDLRHGAAHDIIGDRAYGDSVDIVSRLGEAACEGLQQGGVLPVIKHIPGHGRALVDSHHDLPRVAADRDTLERTDFEPFRRLARMPLAMTAHIVYEDIDPDRPATTSPKVIGEVVRESIGFDGLLMTDDLSMKALGGTFAGRTAAALAAGCDLVLHCNGDGGEMAEIAAAARPLDESGYRRYRRARESIRPPEPLDQDAAMAELAGLIGESSGA